MTQPFARERHLNQQTTAEPLTLEKTMLQTLLMMILFAANLVHAAFNGQEEKRELSIDADGVETLDIEAGAGSLNVSGIAGTNRILVIATIEVPDADADEARQVIEEDLVLSLGKNGSRADLDGWFRKSRWSFDESPRVHLDVRVPERLSLNIEDRSGSVEVRDVMGPIELDDGSGSIRIADNGGLLTIRDGSGSIEIERSGGDVRIVDGSGSITVAEVDGSVTIEDGSGSIDVRDIVGDLLVPDAGSGSFDYSEVAGRVVADD